MNRIMNWLTTLINRIRNWWSTNHTEVEQGIDNFWRGFDRICRNITRLMVIGVLLNIVASYLYPEFPDRFPAIYGWFDGWLQLGEFAVKAALGGIYSLFTGHWSEFWTQYNEAFHELISQFTAWLATIQF